MFGSFTNMLNKLKTTKIAQGIANNYHKITESAKKPLTITQITDQLFHIDYPDHSNYSTLKEHISQREFQIWNISEYRYEKQLQAKILQTHQQGELHHLCFQYYSNLPLSELILALNSINAFLSLNPSNRVYVHCQDNKMRSGVFLACYLYKFHVNQIQDLSDAILFINKKLSISLQGGSVGEESNAKYNNLHVFFKNFINFLNNPSTINKNQLQLLKIIVNQAPKLQLSNEVVIAGGSSQELKVGLQIRCKQQVIFKNVYESSVFVGDSLCLQLTKKTLTLSDDFLVMLKYIYKNKIYNIVRMQLNTNFIYDRFCRTHKQYIDLSSYSLVSNSAAMFIDFMFEQTNSLSSLANLNSLPESNSEKLKNGLNPREQQQKIEVEQLPKEVNAMGSFSLQEQDQEHHQIDEGEINRKIEEVIKNIGKREPVEEEEPAEEDLEDYLTKLQSQI